MLDVLYFMFIEHFFQGLLLIILLAYIGVLFVVKGMFTAYPEMFLDGMSIFKILKYPFRNKAKTANSFADKHIDKANKLFEKAENAYDNFVYRVFYPIPQVLFTTIVLSYWIYFQSGIGSMITFNVGSLLGIYIGWKIADKYTTVFELLGINKKVTKELIE